MKIFYWSPFSSNIATIKAVLYSIESLIKFGKNKYKPVLLNAVGEWDDLQKKNNINFIKVSNINLFKFILNKGFISSRIIYVLTFLFCFFKLKKILEKEKPEYLILHLLTSLPLLLCCFFNFKTKFILRISGYTKLNFFRKLLWKVARNKIYLVTTPSISTLNNLIEKNIFNKDQIKLLYDPIYKIREIPKKKNQTITYNLNEKFKYILAIGRLTKQKNFKYLINEFSKIKKDFPTYKLLILGEGEEKKNLINLIDKLKLNDEINLIGYQKNCFNYIKYADCFVLTSLYEDPGFVLLEAAISNKIIISSICPNGPKDFFEENNNNGFFFKTDKNDSLYNIFKIYHSTNEDIKFKKLINAKRYSKKFNFFNHFKQIEKILI